MYSGTKWGYGEAKLYTGRRNVYHVNRFQASSQILGGGFVDYSVFQELESYQGTRQDYSLSSMEWHQARCELPSHIWMQCT